MEKRPTWGAGKRNFTSVYLEPLSPQAMRDLLAGLVPGLPDTLRDQILARAEGVPLYAMETVRMLLDRGHLVREGSVYRPTGPVEALEVPETLHALIAARLDGLSDDERRTVQDGAVLGKTFTRQALAALSGATDTALEPILQALVRKEVLSIQADPRSPEHGQYGFLQDLMRRVAYETLAMRDRRDRHLAAAAYMEEAFPDDDETVEVLASHYLDAYNTAPDADDAVGIRARARALTVRAAQRAAALGAPAEAQRYYTQAADLTEAPLERAGLLDQAGEMALRSATQDAAAELSEQARALYEAAGEVGSAARVTLRLSRIDQAPGPSRRRDRAHGAGLCGAFGRGAQRGLRHAGDATGRRGVLRRRCPARIRAGRAVARHRRGTRPSARARARLGDEGDDRRLGTASRGGPRAVPALARAGQPARAARGREPSLCEPVRPRLPARPLRRCAGASRPGHVSCASDRQPPA